MVSPIIRPPFSPEKSEDAVAFFNAGNAIPNKKGGPVNAAEQKIKMRRISSGKACAP
jgi:hypothetical protein